jgi:hypothetical protein
MTKFKAGQVWQSKEYPLNIRVIERDFDKNYILLKGNDNFIYKTYFGRTHILLTDQEKIDQALTACYHANRPVPGYESFFNLLAEKEMSILADQLKSMHAQGVNGIIKIVELTLSSKNLNTEVLRKVLNQSQPVSSEDFKDYRDVAYEKVRARLERNPTLYSVRVGINKF